MKKQRDLISIVISIFVFLLMYSISFMDYSQTVPSEETSIKEELVEEETPLLIVTSTIKPSNEIIQKQ